MAATKSLILGTDPNAYLAPVQGWKQSVQKLESSTAIFKGYVDKPGGTYWEGQFAEAAQQNAGDGLKTVGSIRDTVDSLADEVTSTVTYGVLPPLNTAKAIINHAQQQPGVTVNEDLSMTYTAPQGMSDEAAEKSRQAVATMAKELQENADKWWVATQTVKGQVEAGEGKIAGELSLAAATFNVNNAAARTAPANAPGTTNAAAGIPDDLKKLVPGLDPAATTPAGAAPVGSLPDLLDRLSDPAGKPNEKPAVDPRLAGSLLGNPAVRDERQGPARLAPRLQPEQVEAFKDLTRHNLQRQGIPADQIEQRVNEAVDSARAPHFLPDAPDALPGNADLSRPLGDRFIDFTNDVHEGFYDSAGAAVQEGKNLTGQGGPGAPGVAESWGNLAKDSGKAMFNQLVNPIGAAFDEAQRAVTDPGHFAGQKLFEVTAAAPTLPLAGEGAALTRGLEGGAIERGVLGDLSGAETRAAAPHGPIDTPAGGTHPPTPVDHPSPSTVEHPTSGTGGHGSSDNGHGVGGGEHPIDASGGDHHAPLGDSGGWESPSGGSLSAEQNAAANQFLDRARQAEPHITQSLQAIVDRAPGSELTGLEYRLKGEDSFKGKLFGSLIEDPRMSMDGHLAGMKDSVRYTMQSPTELYAANTQRAIDSLVSNGYEPVKIKNTWGEPGYQGINSFWRDPSTGQTFEVQFHTPSSFDAKMQTHPLYEQERAPDVPPQRIADLRHEQQRIFESVPRPPGSAAVSVPSSGGHK